MTRELAEKILVALAPLREGSAADLAREAFALANAFDAEAIRPAPVPSLADAEWRDAPRAPASVPTPAIDPRRTVGAVVDCDGYEYAVIREGEGKHQRPLEGAADEPADWHTESADVFVRWMDREECERHGIPYVDRTAPASKPVDREGLIAAMKKARSYWSVEDCGTHQFAEMYADAAIKFLGGAS